MSDGDAACWLDRVCDECGGFIEGGEGGEARADGEVDRPHVCRVPATPEVGSETGATSETGSAGQEPQRD